MKDMNTTRPTYLETYTDILDSFRDEFESQWDSVVQQVTSEGIQVGTPNVTLIEAYCDTLCTGETLRDFSDLDSTLLTVGEHLLNDNIQLLPRTLVEQARNTCIAILGAQEGIEENEEDLSPLEGALFDLNVILAAWPESPSDSILEQVRNLILPPAPN